MSFSAPEAFAGRRLVPRTSSRSKAGTVDFVRDCGVFARDGASLLRIMAQAYTSSDGFLPGMMGLPDIAADTFE